MLTRLATSTTSLCSRQGLKGFRALMQQQAPARQVAQRSFLAASLPQAAPSFASRPRLPLSRQFASNAAATAKKPDMFCFQCEQTEHGTGCTTVGVCGKTPETAALQDLLIDCLKGVSQYADRARAMGARDIEMDRFMLKAVFSTLTNVNFDAEAIGRYIQKASQFRDKAKAMYEAACAQKGIKPETITGPAQFNVAGRSLNELHDMGLKVGVLERQAERGADVNSIQEMVMYGIKGLCAYAEHASMLGKESEKVYDAVHSVMNDLTNAKPTVDSLLALAMKVGETNFQVMAMLDAGHCERYGNPTPTSVSCVPKPGKCILVSGHDLTDLEEILKQTEGTGVNVYTHGEMLPAHGYPGLRKYPHLAGHYGGPWQLQRMEFSQFPGAIVMTSNCIIEPRRSYKERIFTRQMVGWPGVSHLESNNFKPVIEAAKEAEGFTEEDSKARPSAITTGFGRDTVMSQAGTIVDMVKNQKISHFYVIGGCDGSEGERNYFRELALSTPKDSVILTLGCGKYRFNRAELGNLEGTGIPRVLDMGQCNDAYGAIVVAAALAKAFNTTVNGLPLSFAISWFEQKAVAVLLTLLHLGVQNIRLGPNLPGFVTPNVLNVLVEKFGIKKIGEVQSDLAKMNQNQ